MPHVHSSRRRGPRLLRAATFFGVLAAQAGCVHATPRTPASLSGSRDRVRVTYPATRTVQARSAQGDSTLAEVTWIEGWPTAVRGDTVELQVDHWRTINQRTHRMHPPSFTVLIPREAGATFETRAANPLGTALGIALAIVGVLAAGFAMSGGLTGD